LILVQKPDFLHNLTKVGTNQVLSEKPAVSTRTRAWQIILIVSALLLAVIGQMLLLWERYITGGILYISAAVLFILATRDNRIPELSVGEPSRRKIVVPPILLVTSLIVSFVVCCLVGFEVQFPFSVLIIPLAWGSNILLFAIAILHGCGWRFPVWHRIVEKAKSNRIEIGFLLFILLFAFVVRIVLLSTHPFPFANDEGVIGLEVFRLQNGQLTNVFSTGPAAVPMLNFLPTLISEDLLGRNIAAVRIVSVLEGVLTVLFLYLAAKEAFGKRVGFISAAILAFLPVHIHFSRTGFNCILLGFYPVLLVWLVLRAIRTGRISSYLLAGLVAACAFYTHMGAWISIAFAVGILGYFCVFHKGYLRQNWTQLLIFLGGFLIVIAPQAIFFIKHPDLFASRWDQVGVFQSGWLSDQIAITGKSATFILGDQFLKSTLAFISIDAPGGFYTSPQPYFIPLAAVFLVLGLGYSILRFHKPSHLFLFAWFWSVIILGGMLTGDAPASSRLIAALPAAAIFIGIGLNQTALTLARLRLVPRRIGSLLIGLVVLVAAIDGIKFYFVDYREKNYYGDHSNEVEFASIRIMQQLGKEYHLVLFGLPELTVEFADYPFLLDGYTLQDAPTGNTTQASTASGKTFFVAIPSRKAELEAITHVLPGGTWLDLQRQWFPNEPLFSAYIVPAAAVRLSIPQDQALDTLPKRSTPPAWLWWLVAILASLLLELCFLPLIWRHRGKKEYLQRIPWRWFVSPGKKPNWLRKIFHWWLEW
jgi:4-amino-4-deoxy-L-arabinose transferase-like glycosyltransferase